MQFKDTIRLMSLTQKVIRHKFVMQLIAFGVFANGFLLVTNTLFNSLYTHSRQLTSLVASIPLLLGLSLIYLATLINRKKRTAYLLVMPLYGLIFAINIVELVVFSSNRDIGLSQLIRSFIIPIFIAGGLYKYKDEYKVRSDIQSLTLAIRTSLLVLLVAFAFGVSGYKLLDDHDFHTEINTSEAVRRTIDQFDLTSVSTLQPYTKRAVIFTDSLSIISLGALLYVFTSLFKPIKAKLTDQTHNREIATALLEDFPASSEDYFKIWPNDKSYFFNWRQNAFLAYHVQSGVALVVGDPAGKNSEFSNLIKEFTEFCKLNDWLPSFIHIDDKHINLYKSYKFELQKIGEEAILDIEKFYIETSNNKYFRNIKNKFLKSGFTTEVLMPPHNQAVISRLTEVSENWLKQPGRSERTFMMGYFSEPYMQRCEVMVLKDAAGTIQAFINQVNSFNNVEANYDLLRQNKRILTNSNDFLLLSFIEHLKGRGFKRLNLGLCPLIGLDDEHEQQNVINSTLKFVYANGDRIYSFSGLYKFKAKYEPDWSDRYIAYKKGVRGITRTINALNKIMNKF